MSRIPSECRIRAWPQARRLSLILTAKVAFLVASPALTLGVAAPALADPQDEPGGSRSAATAVAAAEPKGSDTERNHVGNSNYIAGEGMGGDEFRNFFTFDLREFEGEVAKARLEVRRYYGLGEDTERLRLFDVSTRPRPLNKTRGTSPEIFEDLGAGTSYGSFRLETDGDPREVIRLRLDDAVLADIEAHAGRFFSIGGRLMTITGNDFLLGSSSGDGAQRLVVYTSGLGRTRR